MAGTMQDLARMMPNPIIPLWGASATNPAVGQSWTAPDPKTIAPSTVEPNKWGDKNAADWFHDQGLMVTDKGGLDSLIAQLKTYQSPTNPRGDPNNPFSAKYYPIEYKGSSSDPYDGSKYTIHNIEDGMTEQEKALWRQQKYTLPPESPDAQGTYQGATGRGDRMLNWPG